MSLSAEEIGKIVAEAIRAAQSGEQKKPETSEEDQKKILATLAEEELDPNEVLYYATPYYDEYMAEKAKRRQILEEERKERQDG